MRFVPLHATARPQRDRRTRVRRAALLFLSGLVLGAATPTVAIAQDAVAERESGAPHAAAVAEAAQRFGIPEPWIRAVMRVESAGRVRAVSDAGAMGLMQIMPDTWAELRAQYRLGNDPFDPRDNILGGTAYLRAMYDRFGSPGFLAAYNAGPERYRAYLEDGRPLPRETRAYVATLLPMLGLDGADGVQMATVPPPDWREAPLFVGRHERGVAAGPLQADRSPAVASETPAEPDDGADDARSDGLFVVRSGQGGAS